MSEYQAAELDIFLNLCYHNTITSLIIMNHRPSTAEGLSSDEIWNDLSTLERVKMILNNAGHFLSMGLITRKELDRVMATDESEWEYISENHPDILFTNINIKKEIRAQAHRNELKAALNAAFFESR